MQSRRARCDEGDHMVIAAVNPVQEGDAVAGPVGKAQAQRTRIELNRLLDVAGEEEDMRQAPRPDAGNLAPERRPALARSARNVGEGRFRVGRGFGRDFDLNEIAVVIVEPQAVRFDARRRIEPSDAQRLKPFGETVEIVFKRAERDMPELLARPLAQADPDMGVALRLHRQKTAVLVDLKSELAIEAFGDRKIGNGEMKPVDRMNAEFAG